MEFLLDKNKNMENGITTDRPMMLPVGQTIKNSFKYYKSRFKLISGIVVLPLALYFLATVFRSFGQTFFWSWPFSFFGFIAAILSTLAIYQAIVDGSEHEILACYQHGAKKFLSFVWVAVLSAFTVLGGFILGGIPGGIVFTWLAFAILIVFIENEKGMRALVKSRNYVRGYWWPVFGRSLLFAIILSVLSSIVTGILTSTVWIGGGMKPGSLGFGHNTVLDWANFVHTATVFLFFLPMQISFMYSLYLQLKQIKINDPSISIISGKTRGWFIGLAIVGLVVPILVLILVAIFAFRSPSLGDFRNRGVLLQEWMQNQRGVENISTSTQTVATTTTR